MNDMDAALTRLAQEPGPPGIEDMEARVLARIGAEPVRPTRGGVELLAIGAALAMGVAGAGYSPEPAMAHASLATLGGVTPLAPSALLTGEQ